VWLVPFAVALAVAGATRLCFPFDGLYGQDAFAYFRYARAVGPHLFSAAPLPHLYWPIGYPITVALLLPITGGSPVAGQVVNAFACAWAAAATALLVRRLGRREMQPWGERCPAIFAGLAVAASGAVLRSSQVVMADGLALGAAAAALFCAVQYAARDGGLWLVGCAFALAWGTVARWMVGLLALPVIAFLVMHWWGGRGRASPNVPAPRRWPWALLAALAALAVLVPALVIAHSEPLSLEKHEWLQGWTLRSAFEREFHTPEGHAIYRLPIAVFYFVRLGWPDYFFPVPFALAAVGAGVLLRERRWMCAVLLVGWPLTALLFLSGVPYENPRFLLPTLPAIGALFGIGFDAVRRAMSIRARGLVTSAVVAAQVAGLGLGAREHARLVARKNADRDLVRWASMRLPPLPNILMAGPSLAFQYYGSIFPRDLLFVSKTEIADLVSSGAPLFLLADVDELTLQWTGLAPERNFDALRRGPGLAVVGTHPPYSLFRVGGGAVPAAE
jgi:MFS family permease